MFGLLMPNMNIFFNSLYKLSRGGGSHRFHFLRGTHQTLLYSYK